MKELDPTAIIMTFAGINIDGLGEDEFCAYSFANNAYDVHEGAKGEITRILVASTLGRVTFTLGQSSSCNDRLSTLAALDRRSGGGIGALIITDLKGTTLIKAKNAWIEKVPDGVFGKGNSNRAWVVVCEKMQVFLGGSTVPDAL